MSLTVPDNLEKIKLIETSANFNCQERVILMIQFASKFTMVIHEETKDHEKTQKAKHQAKTMVLNQKQKK